MKSIVVLFEFCISGLTLALHAFLGCGLCKGDFVWSSSYYRAVFSVKYPEIGGNVAAEVRVYVGESGCREYLRSWDRP